MSKHDFAPEEFEARQTKVRTAMEAEGIDLLLVHAPVNINYLVGCRAKGYAFTQRSKAALIDNLSMLLEKRELTLPRPELWPEGIDELEAFQYSVSDAGNVKTGSPFGYHDDCVVALALAAWPFRPKPQYHTVELIQ